MGYEGGRKKIEAPARPLYPPFVAASKIESFMSPMT